MRSDIQRLCAEHIDLNDTTWRISTDDAVDRLRQSIRQVGLLQSPILLAKSGGFTIVAGFRRIRACRQLGVPEIESRVLAPGTSRLEAARIAIADNALQRPLNWIEMSRAVRLLAEVVSDDHALIREARQVGLALNPDLVSRLKLLDGLHPSIRAGLVNHRIALPMALTLADYPPETGAALAQLFDDLGLGLNKQRDVLQMISEIAARDDRSILEVLHLSSIAGILAEDHLDRNQRAAQVRAALKRIRHPEMARVESRFNRIVKSLRLGPHVKLTPPRDFEGTRYTLSLSFGDQRELERQVDVIKRIAADPDLKDFTEG